MPTVTNAAELDAAIQAIDNAGILSAPDTAYTITLGADISLATDLTAINLASGGRLTIFGNGHTLESAPLAFARGLFVYAGSVDIRDLTIAHTIAIGGGGGGAGLGGGLFIAAGGTVSLSSVTFDQDQAVGASGLFSFALSSALGGGSGGGGGGLGGSGGDGSRLDHYGSGGGGGVGRLASGGYSVGLNEPGEAGSPGILQGAAPGLAGGGVASQGSQAPASILIGGAGGASGGGGGGGAVRFDGTHVVAGLGGAGGAGGFGGGGGGASLLNGTGGAGGFGGGGGTGQIGGAGGFGGGGGGGIVPGPGGFGAGGGGATIEAGETIFEGGGGLGAGGAIFVQEGGRLVFADGTISAGYASGGGGSNVGSGFGAGVFVQGNGTITLAPTGFLLINDAIADQHGSVPSAPAAAKIVIAGDGFVELTAVNSFSGGIEINGGTLDLTRAAAAGSGAITFHDGGTLFLDFLDLPNVIAGLSSGVKLLLPMPFVAGATTWLASPDLLTVTSGGMTMNLNVASVAPGVVFHTTTSGGTNTLVSVACFAAGTRIATGCGQVPVEQLRVGDTLAAHFAGKAPIRWIGHRRTDCRRHPRPWDVQPVRIAPDAFGPGLPTAPLRLSPDHAVLHDGVLIPVRYLVNGITVVQEDVDEVTYWHVELDRHDAMIAEGLPCESYLDTGNRAAFMESEGAVQLQPDFALRIWDRAACAPLVRDGARLLAARRLLHRRALRLGHRLISGAGPYLLADGRTVLRGTEIGSFLRFIVAPATRHLVLCSAAGVPAEINPASSDRRRLGLMLRSLAVQRGGEREQIPLDALNTPGFYPLECGAGNARWRWTNGRAHLPTLATVGHVFVDFEITAAQPGWQPAHVRGRTDASVAEELGVASCNSWSPGRSSARARLFAS